MHATCTSHACHMQHHMHHNNDGTGLQASWQSADTWRCMKYFEPSCHHTTVKLQCDNRKPQASAGYEQQLHLQEDFQFNDPFS